MTNPGHVTRTLLLSRKHPELLLVSRGSGENIDPLAADITSGISQIRSFNLSALGQGQTYDHASQGTLVGVSISPKLNGFSLTNKQTKKHN
jgi:hypothetical protein